jgi:hypothetical protein
MVGRMPSRAPLLLALAALVLAGCGARAQRPAQEAALDPAVAQALAAPLLIDPDLVSLDRRTAVLADPADLDASLPPDDFAPATAAAARAEAAAIAGRAMPEPLPEGEPCRSCGAALIEDRAAALGVRCRLEPDLAWALRLPAELPVYPKAHLHDAVGSDASCRVRAASFTAPAGAREVSRFYQAVAARAGFRLRRSGPTSLAGIRGDGARLLIIVRDGGADRARFDLIVG